MTPFELTRLAETPTIVFLLLFLILATVVVVFRITARRYRIRAQTRSLLIELRPGDEDGG